MTWLGSHCCVQHHTHTHHTRVSLFVYTGIYVSYSSLRSSFFLSFFIKLLEELAYSINGSVCPCLRAADMAICICHEIKVKQTCEASSSIFSNPSYPVNDLLHIMWHSNRLKFLEKSMNVRFTLLEPNSPVTVYPSSATFPLYQIADQRGLVQRGRTALLLVPLFSDWCGGVFCCTAQPNTIYRRIA